jgi:predicted acyltransferase
MRLVSLDLFRAISIVLMVVANLGFLGEHQEPHIALVDLIFPFFLFCVGFVIPYSHRSVKRKILRVVVLFAIGVFLNEFPFFDISTIRIMSVLQRIALVYLVCAVFMVRLSHLQKKLMLSALLVAYSVIILVDSSIVSQIDLFVLRGHTYNAAGDPEGLLSTVGAVCSAMVGQIIGEISLSTSIKPQTKQFKKLLLTGTLFILVSLFLGFLSPITINIDKDLWSSSYILYTSGFAIFAFLILHSIFDAENIAENSLRQKLVTAGRIFGCLGANAILFYVVSALVYHLEVLNQSIFYVILYLCLWIAVCNLTKIHVRV